MHKPFNKNNGPFYNHLTKVSLSTTKYYISKHTFNKVTLSTTNSYILKNSTFLKGQNLPKQKLNKF